jgi:hypothetical protein
MSAALSEDLDICDAKTVDTLIDSINDDIAEERLIPLVEYDRNINDNPSNSQVKTNISPPTKKIHHRRPRNPNPKDFNEPLSKIRKCRQCNKTKQLAKFRYFMSSNEYSKACKTCLEKIMMNKRKSRMRLSIEVIKNE